MFIRLFAVSIIYQATNLELLISCLICQLTFIMSFVAFNKKKENFIPWLLLFVNCLTYYWTTDFFSYMEDFYDGFETVGTKEPFYLLIYNITTPSYLLWRSFVWGGAVVLFYFTSKRLRIHPNIAIFVLIMLYLPLFVNGRVTLAMTIYYFGLSFVIKPFKRRVISLLFGFFVASCSFFAHRSFLPLIALFPFFAIPLKKSYFKWLLLSIPALFFVMQYIFTSFSLGNFVLEGAFESFQSSAERTVSGGFIEERNWKNQIMFWLRNVSLVLPALFVFWNYLRHNIYIEKSLFPLLSVSLFLIIFSSVIYWGITMFDTSTFAMRYLNMAGVPVCLLISSLYQNKAISKRTLYHLIFMGFMATEILFIVTYLIHGYTIV